MKLFYFSEGANIGFIISALYLLILDIGPHSVRLTWPRFPSLSLTNGSFWLRRGVPLSVAAV